MLVMLYKKSSRRRWPAKAPSGVRIAAGDIAKIGERLKLAQQHYKGMYDHQD